MKLRLILKHITVYMKILIKAAYIFVCAIPLIMLCVGGGRLMLPIAAAIFLHECAHLTALLALGGRVKRFSPAPFGLCMEFDECTLSLRGEAVVCFAGCLVNFISFAVSVLLYCFFKVDILDFGTVSLLFALVNLIPSAPLDGGRLLCILLSTVLNPFIVQKISAVITYIFAFALFLVASYMLLTSVCGIYPLLFSFYVLLGNVKMLEKAFS